MQLDRTYDIYGMTTDALLRLLPREFDTFAATRPSFDCRQAHAPEAIPEVSGCQPGWIHETTLKIQATLVQFGSPGRLDLDPSDGEQPLDFTDR
jgi:hypothetical protein